MLRALGRMRRANESSHGEKIGGHRQRLRRILPDPTLHELYNLPVISPRSFARSRNAPANIDSPMLFRFVLVSMLLHMLVLLIFGTSTGGRGAQRGDGAWG